MAYEQGGYYLNGEYVPYEDMGNTSSLPAQRGRTAAYGNVGGSQSLNPILFPQANQNFSFNSLFSSLPSYYQDYLQGQAPQESEVGYYADSLSDIYKDYLPYLRSAVSQYGMEQLQNPYFMTAEGGQADKYRQAVMAGSLNPFAPNASAFLSIPEMGSKEWDAMYKNIQTGGAGYQNPITGAYGSMVKPYNPYSQTPQRTSAIQYSPGYESDFTGTGYKQQPTRPSYGYSKDDRMPT